MIETLIVLGVGIGAFAISVALTPVVIRLANRVGLVDAPGVRKVHKTPIPRLGGAAISLAALTTSAAWLTWGVRESMPGAAAVLAGATLVLLVGLIDDVRPLPAKVKFLGQLLAAGGVCASGVRIDALAVEGGLSWSLGWLAWPVTLVWIAGISNSINLIDGLDGLAGGLSAIACAVLAGYALFTGQLETAAILLALLGGVAGFLVFNFNPAKIFLGDGGTYFIGFLLSAGSVLCAGQSGSTVPVALTALALGVPIFDTLLSMLRRLVERRSLFAPDRGHIHHRLLASGLHQRHVAVLIYLMAILTGGLGLFMTVTRGAATAVVFGGVCVLLMLLFRMVGSVRVGATLAGLRRNQAIGRQAKLEKRHFEHVQLILREAENWDAWWRAVSASAHELGFVRVSLLVRNRDGTARTLIWQRTEPGLDPRDIVRLAVPVRDRRCGPPLRAEVDVQVNGSLEDAGRRVTLFGRLLDENGLDRLPGRPGAAAQLPARTNEEPIPQVAGGRG